MCNSMEFNFDRAAILIGSQRDSFAAVAHCPVELFFRGATVKEIPLTQGKVALVDDEDFERISRFKWQACQNSKSKKWYARRTDSQNGRKQIWMHRLVLDSAPTNLDTDHRNGNGLDNRRENLRIATRSQNKINTKPQYNNSTGFKGVYPHWKSWQAAIWKDGRKFFLGSFPSPESAALAYDIKAVELFGEFAWLNFPRRADD